ncbi:DUF418 domain-containing protein [Sphingomonas daechungensis]|uniref:DUF418 domain-containing protein n=1 Tax=Sphingomonas daechungensis TaxID=1176646 RepID=UPI0037851735
MATLPSTGESGRIITLDIIRGVAVMGIFSVNVIAFAMIEAAYFNPAVYGGSTGPNFAVWATNMVLIDGKMRSLFSMLFGASMLLVIERAEASGRQAWLVHARRMLVLLGFGLIHYYFIWFGDILTLYAVCGLVVFLFRNLSIEKQVALGAAFMVGHMLLFTGFLIDGYHTDVAAHAPNAPQAAIDSWNAGFGSFAPDAQTIADDRAIHLGTYLDYVRYRLSEWTDIFPTTIAFIPDTIGLMLLGMAGYRSGFLTGEWSNKAYRRVAVISLSIGFVGGAGVVGYDVWSGFSVLGSIAAFVVVATPFITVMAFGYAAKIILLTRRFGPLAQRIAATGRCAFSNYLGTSIVASLIFYGWGLGYYGSLSRWQAWCLVPLVWVGMLLWSKPWLERFHYGPLEWAWRSLARGKMQPMRKTRATPATA